MEPAAQSKDTGAAKGPIDNAKANNEKKTTAAEKKAEVPKKMEEEEYEDDMDWGEGDEGWGDTDFGEVETKEANAQPSTVKQTEVVKAEAKKSEVGSGAKDLAKDVKKGKGGLLEDLDKDYAAKEKTNANEDKFNKVMSSSKENGGLLASIGLKNKDIANDDASLDEDNEEAPHNKSDLFDTSKDRVAKKKAQAKNNKGKDSDEDFDLGFSSSKKKSVADSAGDSKKKGAREEDLTEEQQKKEIEEQFKMIYEGDPELRKTLERSDVANFTIEEKYQIIEAYMAGGGAAGLQIELEDEDYEKDLAQMNDEDRELLNANFAQIYARDPELRAMLPENIDQLSDEQKYQILVHYQRAEEADGLGTSNEFMSGDDSVIVHEGKMYRRV